MGEYMPSYDPNREWLGILIDIGGALILFVLFMISFMTMGVFVARPRLPLLIGSAIPSEFFSLPVRLVTTLLQLYLVYSAYSTTAFAILVVYTYFVSLAPFVNKELHFGRKSYRTLNTLRQPADFVRIYRSFQIINMHAMSICGYFIIPQQIIFGHFIVFCNTMLITNFHKMPMTTVIILSMWSVTSTVYWSAVLAFGAHLYHRGEIMMNSWRRHTWETQKYRKYMNKFRKSCKPITLHFGRTFVIRRLSVLKFIKGLTVSTFRALAVSMNTH
ncbi:unnamed protein product [Orchesella dallaii]|uniref:Uncharacterized protein n=1 Tax=Orchesella dallaii TaxID=48710 RepID=A0ABP1QHQ5_9HEXA